jgi:hypothetical protein
MTTTVVIPATMTSNGVVHTYSDDSNPITGLDGGGHVDRLVPMILDTVYVANYALTQANNALATAATVAQSPYTNATSSTELTIGTGSKSFTLNETGKAYSLGQTVNVSDGTGVNVMTGTISAFDAGTGAITVNVTTIVGAGTATAWVVSIGALGGGLAYSLDTTGAAIDISQSAPPSINQALVATSPTTATWQYPVAYSLDTTGSPVDISASAPPVAKQLLTATSPTTAVWMDAPKSTPDFLLINAGIR